MFVKKSDQNPSSKSGMGLDIGVIQCPLCSKNGKDNVLKLFQINFEEAVLTCENVECFYPAGVDIGKTQLVQRRYLEMLNHREQQMGDIDNTSTNMSQEDDLVEDFEKIVGDYHTDSLVPEFECGFDDILEYLDSPPDSEQTSGLLVTSISATNDGT